MNRRDFLKFLNALPLLGASWHFLSKSTNHPTSDQSSSLTMPNILILVFDALSARHISLHGYQRQTTPNLCRFAERATVFHRHYSAGNFTTPGTASLLTGTFPWTHRGIHLYGTVADDFVDKTLFSLLMPDYYISAFSHNPIAEGLLYQFREHIDHQVKSGELSLYSEPFSSKVFPGDYNVAFWSEQILRGYIGKTHGSFALLTLLEQIQRRSQKRNAESFIHLFPRGIPTNGHGTDFLLEDAIDWIMTEISSAPSPFLGYYHFFPPHFPCNPRYDFIGIFDDGWTPPPKPPHFFTERHDDEFLNQKRVYYDEYIAYADAEFGRLFDFIQQTEMLENTYVIFTSDHGEMFERGIWAHTTPTLFEPIIHIPLILSKPGQYHREDVYENTMSVDLLPTLLHMIGKSIPDWCEGSILPTFGGSETRNERSIYSVEAKGNPKFKPLTKATFALVRGHQKLIHYLGYEGFKDEYELFDLENDPQEMLNLYPSNISLAEGLKAEMAEKLTQVSTDPTQD
jgi:arylsulfatase A-like enzyme